ncbi:MAG: diguanylate cyclase [Leptolyngbyaceae cyanobacterium]
MKTDERGLNQLPAIATEDSWLSLPWEAQLTALAETAQEIWQGDRVQIWWEQTADDGPSLGQVQYLSCVADTARSIAHFHPSHLAIDALELLWPETVDTFANLLATLEDPAQFEPVFSPGIAPSAVLIVAVQSQQGTRGLILGERQQPWAKADIWTGAYVGQLLGRAGDHRGATQIQAQLRHQTKLTQRLEAELNQATQAWQESQVFIQGILNASPCVIYVYDNLINRITYSNGELSQQLGYTLSEVSQMPGPFLQEVIHPEDATQVGEQRQRWLEDRTSDILQLQYRILLPNGDWRWLLIREAVLTADSMGLPQQTVGTAIDITPLKSKEIALQRANDELKRLALIDELTQVFNRRHFERYLQAAWSNMASAHSPLSLLLCDIDFFKGFNDTHGHPAGDRCLKQVAHILHDVVGRGTDVVARYGGEEFAVLLPNTDGEGAIKVAERIQAILKHQPLSYPDGIEQRVTVSLGLATIVPSMLQNASMLVSLADQALYQAKFAGRNRYCVASISPMQLGKMD